MKAKIGNSIDVYSLEDIPATENNLRYFACIGGSKNFQCILDYKELSRAEIMKKYSKILDKCHIPIYEDDDIIICQDAQIAIPGFYIVATKEKYKRFSSMDINTYKKCLMYSSLIRKALKENFGIKRVFMYYDEHYKKNSSTHFWIMPIYEDVLKNNNLEPSILNYDVWKYQDLFEFQYNSKKIYEINEKMRLIMNRK